MMRTEKEIRKRIKELERELWLRSIDGKRVKNPWKYWQIIALKWVLEEE